MARNVIWYVFVGSRGGETRLCIVRSLLEKPKNPRELALEMNVDYSTITHSLRVLEKNRLVYTPEKKYAAEYRTTPEFELFREEFEKISKQCTKREKVVKPQNVEVKL